MKPIRKLPDTELEVMQALWACPSPAARQDMQAILEHTHPMALTTLLTLISRLSEKGFLKIHKDGRSARYIPLISQQDYLASQTSHFLRKLCGGSLATFATALCDSGLTKEEISQLRALLEDGQV